MHCATCSNGALIEIRMQVAGSHLTFRRCGRCELQTWASTDGEIALDRVIELVRRP